MNELSYYPMKKLTIDDIKKDNSISWIIKSDLLESDEVYEVTIEDKEYDRYSEEIIFMRKYNRKRNNKHSIKKFIFNLYSNKVFFTITKHKYNLTSHKYGYSDTSLEYSYGKR